MGRLFAVMVFVATLFAAQAAFAKDHDKKHSVPELSGAGAAAGLVVVGAAVAIVLGRRRSRKS
jgi:hypothetical protein